MGDLEEAYISIFRRKILIYYKFFYGISMGFYGTNIEVLGQRYGDWLNIPIIYLLIMLAKIMIVILFSENNRIQAILCENRT